MFQDWSFQIIDSLKNVRVEHRQVIEAEFAGMVEVWQEHEDHFSSLRSDVDIQRRIPRVS
jgi:hypothetical protein